MSNVLDVGMTDATILKRLTSFTAKNAGIYTPLSGPDATRLLALGQDGSNGDLTCQILHFDDFRDAPEYDALSYCWGDLADTVTINCGGKPLVITRSLSSILQNLRCQKTIKFLWVDAICINQSDPAERTQQVMLMKRIYSHASRVWVWLGDTDPVIQAAMNTIDTVAIKLCAWIYGPGSRAWLLEKLRADRSKPDQIAAANIEGQPYELWPKLAPFFANSWFNRIWVIQEVQSGRDVRLLSGTESIDWVLVALVVQWLLIQAESGKESKYFARAPVRLRKNGEPSFVQFKGRPVEAFRRAKFMADVALNTWSEAPFLEVLAKTRCFSSSDARDKVYAMLQHPVVEPVILGDSRSREDRSMTHLGMQPDYSKTSSEVYLEVALSSIRQSGGLNILSHTYFDQPSAPPGLAWVPQWDVDCEEEIRAIPTWKFNACGTMRCILSSSIMPLQLKAVSLGTITTSSNLLAIGHQNEDFLSEFTPVTASSISELVRLAFHANGKVSQAINGDTGPEQDKNVLSADFAAWSTQSTGKTLRRRYVNFEKPRCDGCWEKCVPEEIQGADPLHFVYTCPICCAGDYDLCLPCYNKGRRCFDETHQMQLRPPNGFWIGLGDEEYGDLRRAAIDGNAQRAYRYMRSTMLTRLWFSTSQGYKGSGVRPLHCGDVVAVLFGARVPFILRPEPDGRYRLVGDCYVNGMMDGEAIDQLESGILETQTFELC